MLRYVGNYDANRERRNFSTMQRILPKPARFTKREYDALIKAHPHVEHVLMTAFVAEDGEQIEILKKIADPAEVLIYIGLLSDEQRQALGVEAVQAIQKQLHKSGKRGLQTKFRSLNLLLGLIGIGLLALLLMRNSETLQQWLPFPSSVSTPTSAMLPIAATAEPQIIQPTATPSPLQTTPVPTSTPLQATPIPTHAPSPVPPPLVIPLVRRIVFKDVRNQVLHPNREGRYAVKPGEQIAISVETEPPVLQAGWNLEYHASRGTINANGQYAVPNAPGTRDSIMIRLINPKTASSAIQKLVKVAIIETPQ